MSPSSWRLLADFFDDPWFRRIWVVQEVAESQEARLLLGDMEIPWQDVVNVAKKLRTDVASRAALCQFAQTKGSENVLFMNNNVSLPSHDPIPILLQIARDFEATDPRDKVYAMLHRPIRKSRTYIDVYFRHGQEYVEFLAQSVSLLYLFSVALDHLITDIHLWCLLATIGIIAHYLRYHKIAKSIAVDVFQRFIAFLHKLDRIVFTRIEPADTIYNMLGIRADYSLTAPTVYRMVATRLIERTHKLNILSYVDHGTSLDMTYPSWVPRWDQPSRGAEILAAFQDHDYQASGEMEHTRSPSASFKHADHLIVEGIRFSKVSSSISEVITSVTLPHLGAGQSAMSIDNAITSRNQQSDASAQTSESMRRKLIATLTAGRLGRMERENITYELHLRVAAALRASYGRRQFLTENGHLGIGPIAMQAGDIVCILFGGSVPYILRPTDTDGLYRIVGESYVHGIMRGEVVEGWRAGRCVKETFALC